MRDAQLRFAEAGLFRARWSPAILDEWRRSLLVRRPELEGSIDAQIRAMACAFPESCVTGGDALIASLDLPDAKTGMCWRPRSAPVASISSLRI